MLGYLLKVPQKQSSVSVIHADAKSTRKSQMFKSK